MKDDNLKVVCIDGKVVRLCFENSEMTIEVDARSLVHLVTKAIREYWFDSPKSAA